MFNYTYCDFDGYPVQPPKRKKDFPKGVFFLALCDSVPREGVGEEAKTYKEAYMPKIIEVRYDSAEVSEDLLPADREDFQEGWFNTRVVGHELAFYGWAEAGKGFEDRLDKKVLEIYEETDINSYFETEEDDY